MNPHFAKLMTHTLTIQKLTRDWTGAFVVNTSYVDVKGFVEFGRKLTTNLKGEEELSTALVFLPNTLPEGIGLMMDDESINWRINMTAPYERSGLVVIKADPIDDPRSGETHHYEVWVK